MSNYPDDFKGTNMDEPRERPEREYEQPELTEAELALLNKRHHVNPLGLPTNPASFKDGEL